MVSYHSWSLATLLGVATYTNQKEKKNHSVAKVAGRAIPRSPAMLLVSWVGRLNKALLITPTRKWVVQPQWSTAISHRWNSKFKKQQWSSTLCPIVCGRENASCSGYCRVSCGTCWVIESSSARQIFWGFGASATSPSPTWVAVGATVLQRLLSSIFSMACPWVVNVTVLYSTVTGETLLRRSCQHCKVE